MDMIPGSSILGFGFDALNQYSENALTQAILTPVSGQTSTFSFGGVTYAVPNNVSATQGTGDNTMLGTAFVAESQRDFQSYFAAKAGISGSYGAFKGAFNAAFESASQTQQVYWYCIVEGSYEAWTVLLQQD